MAEAAPLVVIVGPTASGKTSLAIRLAKHFGGEIISADSRAVYQGLDIGTAKPSIEERDGVPHWGIDLVSPNERFTVVDFQRYALEKIQEIRSRCHVPFLVGGTGLYVDSVIYKYEFPDSSHEDVAKRRALENWTIEALHEYCTKNNIELPENRQNKRYVVNNIMRNGQKRKRNQHPTENTIVVGITTYNDILRSRIESRAGEIWRSGLIDETHRVSEEYGWQPEAMTGNTYRVARDYLQGKCTEDEARSQLAILDRQLAKRQLTWFRRDEHIMWLGIDDAYTYLAQRLAARSNS